MSIKRLNPPIPVFILEGRGWPTGSALAHAWVDPTGDHQTIWRVCLDINGQWWDVPGKWVRGVHNITQGRNKDGNVSPELNRDGQFGFELGAR